MDSELSMIYEFFLLSMLFDIFLKEVFRGNNL